MENQIHNLNLNNIAIKGELQEDEVINKLKDSDLFVSPCKIAKDGDMDGFPTIFLNQWLLELQF